LLGREGLRDYCEIVEEPSFFGLQWLYKKRLSFRMACACDVGGNMDGPT
jgi:hypothetical protein